MQDQETSSVREPLFPLLTLVTLEIHVCRISTSDFLEEQSKVSEGKTVVPIAALWHVLITGLSAIWPSRLSLAGVPLGDVWPCTSLKHSLPKEGFEEGDDLVPFHKLTGWTTYSLMEPMEKILGWKFDGIENMTGLPEYRNGECHEAASPASIRYLERTCVCVFFLRER